MSFERVTPPTGKRPPALYSHSAAAQHHLQPLYSDFGVLSQPSDLYGEGSIFVHGGVLSDGSISDGLWQYRVKSESWNELLPSPLAVADHVMVIVDNRWLIVHGGQCNARHGSITDNMYIYDTKVETWEQVQYKAGTFLSTW